MKTVLCFGTFDILHEGHVHFLSQAKQHADRLMIVMALDATVLEVKGQLPYNSQELRKESLQRLDMVDHVRFGYEDDKYRVIEEIRPDVIFLGYDQQAFVDRLQDELTKRGLAPVIMRGSAHHPERFKSSLLRPDRVVEDKQEDEVDTLPI